MVTSPHGKIRLIPEPVRDGRFQENRMLLPTALTGPGLTLTRVQTHKTHQTIAATRQTEARKFLASLS